MGPKTTKLILLDSLLQEKLITFNMNISSVLRAWNDPNGYLYGTGGRAQNNMHMQGTTMASLKHHKALQPLFIIMAGGMIFVSAYCFRLATKTTDINWSKNKDPLSQMDYYKNRQFKWFNPAGTDYSNLSDKRQAPEYTK